MKVLSNWRSVRLWESAFERDLHRRHSLRTHGLLLGTCTLLLMWAVSALQMMAGNDSLALRYAVTLGVGYLGYLGLLRWWAQRLVEGRTEIDPDIPDVLDLTSNHSAHVETSDASAIGDLAGGALEAAAGADEGAVIVVPVVAIFLVGIALVTGAGALALLYFGWDALLAVAVEIAFSYVSARAAVRVAREGWLTVAVKLTWKPLLGALLCAVLLGAVIDRFMPQVNSLPQAVRVLLHR
ncbi:hypothetical protein [Variovorax arabinosiphilus]|uniref:hypothetical protein n=1 Tax=Variovorax arabinosiphilus TaxID=3053498 RepID=UPI0025762A95|nr:MULTISPECIES: hypothetical protein [unclassified Variovorax]MDM0121310.1 hypothetical protein [Variovorax sp. J2L1-78]MDM0130371.1 hypothetical protein [Variovorax sp. J2L1-63]MDM0234073.1 hypothetical protein [Variovorax sp. J2R1-6]